MSAEPRVVVMSLPACLGEKRTNQITRERWEAITAPFPPLMRGRVANLAAHNYVICAVDGALLITHPYCATGEVWHANGAVETFAPEHNAILFPPAADQKSAYRMVDARVQKPDGTFGQRTPSEDGLWPLVHAGVFATPTPIGEPGDAP